MNTTRSERRVIALALGVMLARVAAHLGGADRYAALLTGGTPEGAWDAVNGPAWCALVVLLHLGATVLAPIALLTALGAWALRTRAPR